MSDIVILVSAIITAIAGIMSIAGVNLRSFGKSPMPTESQELTSQAGGKRRTRLWTALGFSILSILLFGVDIYQRSNPKFEYKETAKFDLVSHRHFINETVSLDGYEYSDCTFTNVTFQYNGTTAIRFHDNHFEGVWLKTQNSSVMGTVVLLKTVGLLPASFVLEGGPNREPLHVTPPYTEQKPITQP